MRDIEDDSALITSWNDAMKEQRRKAAAESQSIDLTPLATTPMHDRLTFERAQAVEEKMAERVGKSPQHKVYHGWMDEIERQVAVHERGGGEGGGGEKKSSGVVVPRKRGRAPSSNRCVWGSLEYL
jgi:hypothetical protein